VIPGLVGVQVSNSIRSAANIRLLTALIVVLGFFFLMSCSGKKQNDAAPLRIVSWGGRFQQDLSKDWWKPAADSCGIKLEPDSWDGDYGALSARIQKGINDWDLVHVEAHYVQNPAAVSLFENFDRDLPGVDDRYRSSTAVPVLEYGYVLAYRTDLTHTHEQPDWKDFLDLHAWPGRRSLRDFPIGNIELALLSEGRDVQQVLYNQNLTRSQIEAQVDDALLRLDSIRSQIIWWSSGDQLQRSLTSGDITMAAAWSGRIWSAYRELCGTSPVEECRLQVNGHTALVSTDWWIIPKNAPHVNRAKDFLECMYTRPEARQGALAFSESQGYFVPLKNSQLSNPSANYFLGIGSSRNKNQRAHIDERFWGQNFEWINARWRQWRARQ
jgi:putative spermidine/putrescine transport system substrate-binding protein